MHARRVVTARTRSFLATVTLALVAACGGGGDGSLGQEGLSLISFQQAGQDNVPLNRTLVFIFNSVIDASSITPLSIQIREGAAFGTTVQGTFAVQGTKVLFKPRLHTLCDVSDAAFKPGTAYSVIIVGEPEEFALRNTSGRSLAQTRSFNFSTPSSESDFLEDLVAGGPHVLSATPGEVAGDPGANAAVSVKPADGSPAQVVLVMSENLDPCTVNLETVTIRQHELGDPNLANAVLAPNGNASGFVPATDNHPSPERWGSSTSTTLSPPRIVPSDIRLIQTVDATRIVIEPLFREFPDNALIVVELTSGIQDFGAQALTPVTFSFTTENRPPQQTCRVLEFAGETPIDGNSTTADVNTARAPSKAQGFLLFAGDGDNGTNLLSPSLPETPASACSVARQANDGTKDDFDPATDVVLDTGPANTCPNTTDGSRAVVWEFKSLRIRSGVTVRVVGANPAILLVQGDATIEAGGRLLVRGDGAGGAPQGRGGAATATTNNGTAGGVGVAGGGNGGASLSVTTTYPARYGNAGFQGYYHSNPTTVASDVGTAPGTGGGHGNTSARWTAQINPNNRNTPSGGGGGHSEPGAAGVAGGAGSVPTVIDLALDGIGGGTYGDAIGRMATAEAGSGGGAGGEIRPYFSNSGRGPGGAGGAGGGFIDISAGGNVLVLGTIDAAGGAGGAGATQPFAPNYLWQPGSGGGGGGSGGGIRLLTPNDITFGPTTVVTAAGGVGGVGGDSQAGGPPRNNGGVGGPGRIVLEDGDSLVPGIEGANVVPGDGAPGLYRNVFDASRFQGGGLTPQATTDVFFVGPWSPTYVEPTSAHFLAGVPEVASRGLGATAMLLEAQAFPIQADGFPDLGTPSGWFTVGHFTHSGVVTAPDWVPSAQPGDVALPPDNVGTGIANLTGLPWIQLRITFYLPAGVLPLDPGPFVDRIDLCFQYDQ